MMMIKKKNDYNKMELHSYTQNWLELILFE